MSEREEVQLYIEEFNDKGEGVAFLKRENSTIKVLVPNVVIGDLIQASLYKRKKRGFYKARLSSVLEKSSYRVEPFCSHTNMCGGCSWQEMDYQQQLKQKEEKVFFKIFQELITEKVKTYPILPCLSPFFYRNKMEFSFSENGAKTKFLGLMIAAASRYVFNVDKCYLAPLWFSEVLQAVKKWWEESSLLAYNHYKNEGHLRCLTIREGKNTQEKMVILTVSGDDNFIIQEDDLLAFEETVKKILPKDLENLSLYLRIQKIEKKTPTKFIEKKLFGKTHITEKITVNNKELSFKISPSSFFQPNTSQAEVLYNKAFELAKINENDIVFDLYCGTGTLGLCFASFVKEVIAIELNADSVQDAKENQKLNDLENFQIHCGDVGKVLTSLMSNKDFVTPQLVIVDPPRAGLDELALHHLKTLKAKKILYISCNPKTQALNIKELLQAGYTLKILQPVDQFPHTAHIENIALLELT